MFFNFSDHDKRIPFKIDKQQFEDFMLELSISAASINVYVKGLLAFTGKSQEPPQLAVGRNGKRGFGGGNPHYGFFLGISPGRIGGTSSRNKIEELSL